MTFAVSGAVAVALTKIMLETQLFAEATLERMHRCLFRCDRRAMGILHVITQTLCWIDALLWWFLLVSALLLEKSLAK